jgi:pimeloyl-ACP methyl ester carboxylesterase
VSANFSVVGFDGPAHGESTGRSTNIHEFEAVLLKLFERFGTPSGIIAHSFGGSAVLFAAMNGLPVKKLINIASPTIDDEIINTYLKTINGSRGTAYAFRKYIQRVTGRPFDELTAQYFIRHIRQEMSLLLVHDEDDEEVSIDHAYALIRLYPRATLYSTRGLGHTRILKDDQVIKKTISFLKGEPLA